MEDFYEKNNINSIITFCISIIICLWESKIWVHRWVLYADGKEATGTFEFILNGYKTRAKYVNGLANGLFERYYPDGSIFIKNEVKDGIVSKIEVYYKSGETLAIITDSKYMKIFNKDGSLVESYDADKNETILYQENENPFIFTDADPTTYNENNAILPKVENGKEVDSNVITKNLGDGLSEVIVDDKVMVRFDDKIGFLFLSIQLESLCIWVILQLLKL